MIKMDRSNSTMGVLCLSVVFLMTIPNVAIADFLFSDSNGVVYKVAASGSWVWAGWSDRIMYTADAGLSWNSYDTTVGLPPRKISSMYIEGTTLWAGIYYDTTLPAGHTYSLNGGLFKNDFELSQWEIVESAYPDFVGNITFDIAIHNDTIWTANWWRGLLRSSDSGLSWDIVLFNSLYPNPWDSAHHRVFSVAVDEEMLLAGTEWGINYSSDRGETWEFIRHSPEDDSSLSADKVVSLKIRQIGAEKEIWASAWRQNQTGGRFGVSVSSNHGQTWRTILNGRRAWSIHFYDDDIFIPTDSGLWYSSDGGWTFGDITDGQISSDVEFYSLAVTDDSTIWLGSSRGLYSGKYDGSHWDKVDFVALGVEDILTSLPDELSLGQNYPNPFNPATKIPVHMKRSAEVRLVVHDILGRQIRTLFSGFLLAGDHNFVWDGKDEDGGIVSGGVYFYTFSHGSISRTRPMILIK